MEHKTNLFIDVGISKGLPITKHCIKEKFNQFFSQILGPLHITKCLYGYRKKKNQELRTLSIFSRILRTCVCSVVWEAVNWLEEWSLCQAVWGVRPLSPHTPARCLLSGFVFKGGWHLHDFSKTPFKWKRERTRHHSLLLHKRWKKSTASFWT